MYGRKSSTLHAVVRGMLGQGCSNSSIHLLKSIRTQQVLAAGCLSWIILNLHSNSM